MRELAFDGAVDPSVARQLTDKRSFYKHISNHLPEVMVMGDIVQLVWEEFGMTHMYTATYNYYI